MTDRQTTEAYLSYKLTSEPSASGKLKRQAPLIPSYFLSLDIECFKVHISRFSNSSLTVSLKFHI